MHIISLIVPVNSLTLKPNQITVNASELINLTCEASPCYPKATIRWYIKGEEIIDQSIIRTEDKGGNDDYNIQTTSFLQYTGDIGDNRANVYCTAINLPDQIVESEVNVLDVQCKHILLFKLCLYVTTTTLLNQDTLYAR